jgi:hypothetical protein
MRKRLRGIDSNFVSWHGPVRFRLSLKALIPSSEYVPNYEGRPERRGVLVDPQKKRRTAFVGKPGGFVDCSASPILGHSLPTVRTERYTGLTILPTRGAESSGYRCDHWTGGIFSQCPCQRDNPSHQRPSKE